MKLELPNFSQRDSRWKLKKVGTGTLSFGSSGCAVCAVADILNFFGYSITPDQLNDNLTANNGFVDKNLIKWDIVASLYPKIKWEGRVDEKGRIDLINERLSRGIPTIGCVDYNPNTPELNQHFAVFIGKDEQGNYFINDPMSNPGDGAYYFQAKYGNDFNSALWGLRLYSAILVPETPSIPIPDPQNSNIEVLRRVDELSLRVAESEISQTQTKDEVNKIVPRLDSIAHDISDLNKDRAILETIQGNMAGIEEKVKLNSETVKSSETNLKAEIRLLQASIASDATSASDEIESIKIRVKLLEEKPASDTGITILWKIKNYFLGKIR